jgi:hypothetical protein
VGNPSAFAQTKGRGRTTEIRPKSVTLGLPEAPPWQSRARAYTSERPADWHFQYLYVNVVLDPSYLKWALKGG